MSHLTNEDINRYIDGELNEKDRIRVSGLIEESEENRKRYTTLLAVHNGLKKIRSFDAPADFTSVFMASLMKKYKAKKQQKVFILSVCTIFSLISLFVVGFLLSWYLSNPGSSSSDISILSNTIAYLQNTGSEISTGLAGKGSSVGGSVLAFSVILSAYIFWDHFKQRKTV